MAVKAYWKRTASYDPFVKRAWPSAFVSPFVDSADVGFSTVSVIISDGTTAKVDASSVSLTVDGKAVDRPAELRQRPHHPLLYPQWPATAADDTLGQPG